jgi:hypothetical protein
MATAVPLLVRDDRAWPREVSGAATQVASVGFQSVRKILFMVSTCSLPDRAGARMQQQQLLAPLHTLSISKYKSKM